MENKIILLDTSILIDYFRKTDKENAVWIQLIKQGYKFQVSVITKYEIYSGANESQLNFWKNVFKELTIVPLNEATVDISIEINKKLKLKRKQIEIADLFIASTAIQNQLPIATLNKKHFGRIEDLEVI